MQSPGQVAKRVVSAKVSTHFFNFLSLRNLIGFFVSFTASILKEFQLCLAFLSLLLSKLGLQNQHLVRLDPNVNGKLTFSEGSYRGIGFTNGLY